MKLTLNALTFCAICVFFSCSRKESSNTEISSSDSVKNEEEYLDEYGLPVYLNSVKGHKEEEQIVGNFTGLGLDTIYVVTEIIDTFDMDEGYKYYAKSNNRNLPTIEMYGCGRATPLLVYEGDVDRDGKDEWGYLHTWINSQWRYYRIYNYDNKTRKWRFLYEDDELLSTPQILRDSGLEIVEKGPKKGYIKINYCNNLLKGICDTIVKPTYTPITEKNR